MMARSLFKLTANVWWLGDGYEALALCGGIWAYYFANLKLKQNNYGHKN